MPRKGNDTLFPTRPPRARKRGRSLADPEKRSPKVDYLRKLVRWGRLPRPALRTFMPWAKLNGELAEFRRPGAVVRLLMDSPAFEELFGSTLDGITAEMRKIRGPKPAFTARELESIRLFMICDGQPHLAAAINTLGGWDYRKDRRALGFERRRKRTGSRDGEGELAYPKNPLPHRSQVVRHCKRFPLDVALPLYRELLYALGCETLALPEMEHAAQMMHLDGSEQPIPFEGTIEDDNGEVVNAHRVTAPEAGYRGRGEKERLFKLPVFGFHAVVLSLDDMVPLDAAVDKFGKGRGETDLAVRVLDAYREHLLPAHPNQALVRVVPGDGVFTADSVRHAAHRAHLLMNAHFASHKQGNEGRIQQLQDKWWRLVPADPSKRERYAHWMINGHRELRCDCGQGHTDSTFGVTVEGKPTARLIGRCGSCGDISVSMGRWREQQSGKTGVPRCFAEVNAATRHEADLSVGNPLTFHDARSHKLGLKRFYRQEGLFGVIVTRFDYLVTRSFRKPQEFELGLKIIFCFAHVLTQEYFACKRAAATSTHTPAAATGTPTITKRAA